MTSEIPARMAERRRPEVTCSATAISSSDGSSLRRTRTESMASFVGDRRAEQHHPQRSTLDGVESFAYGARRRQPTLEELFRFIDESGVLVDYQEIVLSDGHFSPLSCCPS